MPSCQTKFHGTLTFEPEQVLSVPGGLFGFPDETQFLLLELPSARPLVFIQSIRSQNLCFISMPAQIIERDFQLELTAAELSAFGFAGDQPLRMGKELLCLALLNIGERKVTTANLLAPLVIDIAGHRGTQVLVNNAYSHQHPFPAPRLAAPC